jgi:hypothetical protein
MKRSITFSLFLIFSLGALCFAQDDFTAERNAGWKNFSRKNYDKFDFAKSKITSAQLKKLKTDGAVNELALLARRRFRQARAHFQRTTIQEYLEKQAWYKPKANFTNAVLTKTERDNLDLIRLAEAERHDYVQPGDLRLWQTREIPDDKIYTETAANWRILIAEIEAIHGKRFDEEPWLQKYFEERYWYQANPNYDSSVLTDNRAQKSRKIQRQTRRRPQSRRFFRRYGQISKRAADRRTFERLVAQRFANDSQRILGAARTQIRHARLQAIFRVARLV